MIWLVLSILCSCFIFICFKSFEKFNINNLQAIVFNYVFAFSTGILVSNSPNTFKDDFSSEWIFYAFLLGFLFISLFQIMAWVSQKLGVATVSIAVKMSLIIPVSAGVFLYSESLGALKLTGILLALISVILVTYKGQTKSQKSFTYLLLPIVLFLGSGFLDFSLNYSQKFLVPSSELSNFSGSIFGFAGIYGLIYWLTYEKSKFNSKNILAGFILGIPNFGSIYFLVKALDSSIFESSTIFSINNVGVVALSALLGFAFYKEKVNLKKLIGLSFALLSIILLYLAN